MFAGWFLRSWWKHRWYVRRTSCHDTSPVGCLSICQMWHFRLSHFWLGRTRKLHCRATFTLNWQTLVEGTTDHHYTFNGSASRVHNLSESRQLVLPKFKPCVGHTVRLYNRTSGGNKKLTSEDDNSFSCLLRGIVFFLNSFALQNPLGYCLNLVMPATQTHQGWRLQHPVFHTSEEQLNFRHQWP